MPTDLMPYIPFDFGHWRSPTGRKCSRHGLQHGGPAYWVTPVPEGETTVREYCGLCLLAALDQAMPFPLFDETRDLTPSGEVQ